MLEATADRRVIVLISDRRATGNVARGSTRPTSERGSSMWSLYHIACPAESESPPKTLQADQSNRALLTD